MQELLNLPDLWNILESATKPIVLYGMGDGAEKIIDVCNRKRISVAGVFSSDEFVRPGKRFMQWEVQSLAALEQQYGDLIVLLAFGTAREDVLESIRQVRNKHEFYVPDTPVAGEELFTKDYFIAHLQDFQHNYNLLEDQLSRQTMRDILAFKLTGKPEFLEQHTVSRSEMFQELFTWHTQEIFVDAGAYRGDTIEEFITMVGGTYENIIGIEADGKTFLKLKKAMENSRAVSLYNAAVWSDNTMLFFPGKRGRGGHLAEGIPNTRAIMLDSIIPNYEATYMKYDIEGAEEEGLIGSAQILKTSRPKLLVSAYHRAGDLFRLPQLIQSLECSYRFYLRRNPGFPAWDIQLIAISKL